MARVSYPPEVRSSFITAARTARNAGRSWSEALVDAEGAGYKGTEQSLYQLMLRVDREEDGRDVDESPEGDETQETGTVAALSVGGSSPAGQYEYKTLILTTQQAPDAALNERGIDGWAVVTATPLATVLLPEGSQVTRIQYVLRRARS